MAGALIYADWTQLLCEHFFRPERAGQPVTYFVDDDLLGELEGSGDPAVGIASLTEAVGVRLAPDSYSRRFHRIDEDCTRWKVAGALGCPPSLPLLAVTVLAATRMARETGISARNYWRRFDELLSLSGSADRKGINEVLPGLWEQLSWWLDESQAGALGRSTVEADSWWTIIGYALSQALFRESDRQHLTEFFDRIGLAPGEEPSARELVQYFKAWAPTAALSAGAKHMAEDPRYDERLGALLVEEASRWDGVIRDETGRRVGSLVLTLEPFPHPNYRVMAECPAGFPEAAVFADANGFSVGLSSSTEGWYDEAWPLQVEWLSDGLRLESGEFVLALRGTPVRVLGKNRDLGCWGSVRRLEPSEDHYVLSDDEHADAVAAFLGGHALTGWTRVATGGFAPRGWVLFTDVVIEVSTEHDPDGPLAVLVPSIRERPTLRGGLPVGPSLGIYMRGGEPDLWLPSLIDEDTDVTVAGQIVKARPAERISLRELSLPAGEHEIQVGAESRLRFSTVDYLRDAEAEGTGTVAEVLRRTTGGYAAVSGRPVRQVGALADSEVAVAGTRLFGDPANLPSSRVTVVLPIGAESYTVLGAVPGEIMQPKQPDKPEWMSLVGKQGLFPVGFEVYAEFDVVWVLVGWHRGIEVRLRTADLLPVAEASPSATPENVEAWQRCFDHDGPKRNGEAALWLAYRAAAAEAAAGSEGAKQ